MSYSRDQVLDKALDLVKAALSSGSIKLQGSSDYPENNQTQQQADIDYLTGVINGIAKYLNQENGVR